MFAVKSACYIFVFDENTLSSSPAKRNVPFSLRGGFPVTYGVTFAIYLDSDMYVLKSNLMTHDTRGVCVQSTSSLLWPHNHQIPAKLLVHVFTCHICVLLLYQRLCDSVVADCSCRSCLSLCCVVIGFLGASPLSSFHCTSSMSVQRIKFLNL